MKNYPKRLKRSESFLGVHFDFHATEENKDIGKNTTCEMVEFIIKNVKPDYIQCDCKGHPGFSSYPTKVGYSAPNIAKDALHIWRKVTAENGVALFMHYSGVIDMEALKHHPGWARIDENGERDKEVVSTFGDYSEKLLIPQLKELCDVYEVDGVWIDGDCWAASKDYGENIIRKFKEETGIQNIPKQPEDSNFFEFSEFCRQDFRRYMHHYVEEMHKHNANFQIASNWAYTSFMPEPVDNVSVDFISGDYTPRNSLNSARLEGRCMIRQGKPWDLMAWAFVYNPEERYSSTKSINQLKQEASIVLSLGGGFQAYFQQKDDGSISRWQMQLMSEVAEFCRARQKICHNAIPVPQIALVYSGKAFYRKNTMLFSGLKGDLLPMRGVLQNLLESQNSIEILMEHHLTGRMHEYPLIIIPEWDYLDNEFKEELLLYVKSGGNLLVIGPKAAAMFEEELNITINGEVNENTLQWLEYEGWLGAMKTPSQRVNLKEGAIKFGSMYYENDNTGSSEVAASISQYGKGRIAATYLNFGEQYINNANFTARSFLNGLVRELFPKPLVEVKGSQYVDVSVNCVEGKLAVNLVNTAGAHADEKVFVFDEIPNIGSLDITIRREAKPERVTLEPKGIALPFEFYDGEVKVVLPYLEIHEIIVIE